MSFLHPHAHAAAEQYVAPDIIEGALGSGKDGIVYRSRRGTAIKVHSHSERFHTELAAYQRLVERNVGSARGFAVPRLLGHNEKLHVLELSIVGPPCVIDFAQVAFDRPPDFPDEVWNDWQKQQAEAFGARWDEAAQLFDWLKRHCDFYYLDLSPRNVLFAAEE